MDKKIRVLVVEDSLTVRKRLLEVLSSDPAIEVAGEAADGKDAIELCRALRPDVVTLDMMLPVMSGLAATEFIMAHFPTPILIVSSSVNRGELFKTYEALSAGAVEVLEKPGAEELDGVWEKKLLSTVKLISRIKVITHVRGRLAPNGRPAREHRPAPSIAPSHPCRIVALGASTGGPGTIVDILRALPADYAIPILVVIHISEPFAAGFADWLDGQSELPVAYPRDGQWLPDRSGCVFLAPPGRHLVVRGGRMFLTSEAERHFCRPSVDVLFESIAKEYGPASAACLLTGMGRDGAEGLLEIRRAGGLTVAQDEATSVVYGMPKEAVSLGAAGQVLPLPEIGTLLAGLSRPRQEG